MLRTISLFRTPLRSVPKLSLLPISQSPAPSIQKPLLFKNPNHPYPQIPSSRSLPPFSILSSPFSSSSRRKDDDPDDSDGEFILNRDPKSPPKLFVVQPRVRPEARLQVKLAEALNLANSLEEHRDAVLDGELEKREMPPHLVVQNPSARPKSHSETYFGPGTVDTVKCHINTVESKEGVDVVFVNSILSGIQQRNLEREWGRPVLDRVGLIIEIFNAHAQTKEAKLQSELAALMYKRTRLVRVRGPGGRLTFGAAGEAEVVSARGRGSGGRGFISGAGETELQLQRRRIIERRTHLLSQIEEVRRTRALQRASRKRRGGSQGQGLATVAVVGYTNAGKSTLVSALSDADLYSDDRLFATVDPRLRNVILPSGKKVLLSDTVGFISELPIQLVEAFHATLEEVVEADLLVHVLDSSACNVEDQRSSVLQVLQQIGVSSEKLQNMVEVWNKVDLLEPEARDDECLGEGEVDEDGSLSEAEESEVVSSTPSVSESGDEVTFETCVQETIDCSGHPSNNLRKRVEDLPFEPQDVKRVETFPFEPQNVKRVETSAITGVGLQELLHLIDEKLNVQKPSDEKSYDRKWRPSYATDSEAVVQ